MHPTLLTPGTESRPEAPPVPSTTIDGVPFAGNIPLTPKQLRDFRIVHTVASVVVLLLLLALVEIFKDNSAIVRPLRIFWTTFTVPACIAWCYFILPIRSTLTHGFLVHYRGKNQKGEDREYVLYADGHSWYRPMFGRTSAEHRPVASNKVGGTRPLDFFELAELELIHRQTRGRFALFVAFMVFGPLEGYAIYFILLAANAERSVAIAGLNAMLLVGVECFLFGLAKGEFVELRKLRKDILIGRIENGYLPESKRPWIVGGEIADWRFGSSDEESKGDSMKSRV